jgi:hypothetical protein
LTACFAHQHVKRNAVQAAAVGGLLNPVRDDFKPAPLQLHDSRGRCQDVAVTSQLNRALGAGAKQVKRSQSLRRCTVAHLKTRAQFFRGRFVFWGGFFSSMAFPSDRRAGQGPRFEPAFDAAKSPCNCSHSDANWRRKSACLHCRINRRAGKLNELFDLSSPQ